MMHRTYKAALTARLLRPFCTAKPSEASIRQTLQGKFPGATKIQIQDTSGGCGQMFNVHIEAREFLGLSVVKQHRLVYSALRQEIEKIHGLHVHTAPPT